MSPWEGKGREGGEGERERERAGEPWWLTRQQALITFWGGSADYRGAGLGPAEEADKCSLSKVCRGDVQTEMKQVPACGKRDRFWDIVSLSEQSTLIGTNCEKGRAISPVAANHLAKYHHLQREKYF